MLDLLVVLALAAAIGLVIVCLLGVLGMRGEVRAMAMRVEGLRQVPQQLAIEAEARRSLDLHLDGAQRALTALAADAQRSREADRSALDGLRRLEAVFFGSYSKGAAGERLLDDALRAFPQDMILRDVPFAGGRVEFALRLPNGRLVAIDSKWPATERLISFEAATDTDERAAISREIERDVERRVREVGRYVDPSLSAGFAIAAVPDAAFAHCARAFTTAHECGVVLMAYGMTIPYLLALYRLALQYERSIDHETLMVRLGDFDRSLARLSSVVENKLERSQVMLANGTQQLRAELGRLRGSLRELGDPQARDGSERLDAEAWSDSDVAVPEATTGR